MSYVYFDTSVLLPAAIEPHPWHPRCLKLLKSEISKGEVVTSTNHTLAELYSNMTKLPRKLSLPPELAVNAIIDGLGSLLTFVDLTRADYEAALHRCAAKNLVSGVIYDALHLQAALKAGASVLYTANMRDFQRLLDGDEIELRGVG